MHMVRLVNAATVVCLRESLSRDKNNKWDVLLAQGEIKNWLLSTPQQTVIMRYPGEWKFPGGAKDAEDPTLETTAIRELSEELLGLSPDNPKLYFIGIKETKVVKGKRYRMHNFVALAQENPWLAQTDLVDRINTNLRQKRNLFQKSLEDDTFWAMNSVGKHKLSPEVHRIAWFRLDVAIAMLSGETTHVDEFQRREFEKYNIQERDPMYQSMMTLMDIAPLTPEGIKLRARV
jgi:8-oxo-dGTP pyrophosphatase MutT (NUDIX family)